MKKFTLTVTAISIIGTLAAQPSSWSARGVGGGGALFSPSFNPANPNEYYIACDMTELFHTTNLGQSYDQVHFNEFIGGHNSKVCFTNTSGLLYSISYIADVGTPVKSTDNGVTWNTLPGNPDPSEDIYSINVDRANANRVVISDYSSVYFSSNGGTTFTNIHNAATGNGNVVGGAFFDGNNIYVGTNDGVLVSTNGGANWNIATITGLPAGEAIWSFCAAKSGGTTRLFCLTGDAGDIYVGLPGSDYWGFFRGIYTCDFGTTNWTSADNGITATDYPMFIGMAENNINTVYVSGSNDNSEPIVMKSTNAGGNWSHVLITSNNQNVITGWSGDGGDRPWSYGECPFGMCVCPTDPNYVIIGDFGFPHLTSNGGTSWTQAYVLPADAHPANSNTPIHDYYHSIGIENTTSWQVHWMNATTMWSCFSDIRGIRSQDAGVTWSFDYTGYSANSSYRIVQNTGGTLFMATSNIHDMYQSTRLQDAILDATDGNGKIMYSTNNGASWSLLHNFNHPVFWIALDPTNANRAYASVIHYNGGAGVGGVYRCDDLNNLAGSTWTLLSDPPGTEKHPACLVVLNDGTLVATYSGRRNSGGAFTNSSGLFSYNPSTGNWTDLSDPGMSYWTKDVIVDPNDVTQNTWYACVFSGWGGAPNGLGGLYKTTNRGINWTKLTGTTLDRVTSCTFNPNNANQIFITTEGQGLWMSSNINSGTPTFSQVANYPFRQPERVFFNPNNTTEMWVTSFGNGLKTGTLSPGAIPEFTNEKLLNVYPNPASTQLTVVLRSNVTQTLEIFNVAGEMVSTQQIIPGQNKIDIAGIETGMYLVKCGNTTEKLIVQR